jgi:hypothetical protein
MSWVTATLRRQCSGLKPVDQLIIPSDSYKWGLVAPVLDAMRREPTLADTVLPDVLSGTEAE